MSKVVDLGSLIPESRFVSYPGIEGEIEIKPPSAGQVFLLGALSERLGDKTSLPDEEITELSDRMVKAIKDVIPQLKDVELSASVVDRLFLIISEMAIPPVAPELEKRGLDQANPKAQ